MAKLILIPVVALAACGVSKSDVQQMIDDSNPGTAAAVSQADLDALRAELQQYADDAAAAAANDDAGALTGTLDAAVLPDIPEGKLPVRTRILPLSVFGAVVGGGATPVQSGFGMAGVWVPPSGSFGVSFTVPPEIETGSELDLHVIWRSTDPGCSFNLLPNYLNVAGVGDQPPYASTTDGFTGPAAPLIAPASGDGAGEGVYGIARFDGSPAKPLDTVTAGLYRPASGDTCPSATVIGMYVQYEGR